MKRLSAMRVPGFGNTNPIVMNRRNELSKTTAYSTLLFLLFIGTAILAPKCQARQKEFTKWPSGSSPKEVGKRVAERFVAGPHTNFGRSTPPAHITYPEDVTWYGALTFAELSADKDLTARLISHFDSLIANESTLVPPCLSRSICKRSNRNIWIWAES
jgi:hypothetical protein